PVVGPGVLGGGHGAAAAGHPLQELLLLPPREFLDAVPDLLGRELDAGELLGGLVAAGAFGDEGVELGFGAVLVGVDMPEGEPGGAAGRVRVLLAGGDAAAHAAVVVAVHRLAAQLPADAAQTRRP